MVTGGDWKTSVEQIRRQRQNLRIEADNGIEDYEEVPAPSLLGFL